MILKTILPMIFFTNFLFGQELKKVTEANKNPWSKEVYTVLKSDKNIKHGNYQSLSDKNTVIVNGYYKNGQKDSLWTEYQWRKSKLVSKGMFAKDNKVGIWEYYDYKGELEQKYDYSKAELLYNKIDEKTKNKEYRVIQGTDTVKMKLDRLPIYIGGTAMLYNPVTDNIKYPVFAMENDISGEVNISFVIDSLGKTSNYRILNGIGGGCDEEALRVVKIIPENWLPGILNGRPISVEYVLPIKYSLE